MSEELKPCPFCGAEAIPFDGDFSFRHDPRCYFVDEWVVFRKDNWNYRAADERVRELVEVCREVLEMLEAEIATAPADRDINPERKAAKILKTVLRKNGKDVGTIGAGDAGRMRNE